MFKSWTARYILLGVLLGTLFPAAITLTRIYLGDAGGFAQLVTNFTPLVMGGAIGLLIGRQRDQRERDVRRLGTVAEIHTLLSAATGLDTLLHMLAPKWAALIGASKCLFVNWDTAAGQPVPIHPRGPYDEALAALPISPGGQPLARWAGEQTEAKILNCPANAERAMLVVPLAVNQRFFGAAVFINDDVRRRFRQEDVASVTAIVNQVALKFDQIRSGGEIRRRARDMEAIGQVARSLAAGWDIDRILTTVAESTQVRFGIDHLGILTVDESAGEFVVRAQAGPLAHPKIQGHRQKLIEGLAGEAYRSGQQVLTPDVRDAPSYVAATGPEARSELIIPLRSGESVIGVVIFQSRYPDAFKTEDVVALQMLADQVAVAVENARLYEDAQRERRRLSAVLASTGDAVIVTDAANRIQLFNRAAEQLFGVPAPEAIGASIEERLRQPTLTGIYQGAPETQVFELNLSDAATVQGHLTPVYDEAQVLLGRVLTLHDISDLKRLDQLKSQMIRMASHDLRNPLNLAFGYLDLLTAAVADREETVRPLLNGLDNGLRRMEALVHDLLNVERIESEVDRIREPVDLNEVARRAVDELRVQVEHKHHNLYFTPAPEPARVSADPVQIQQVAVNLVNNAIKYTPDGGRIDVRVLHQTDQVVFEVQDNGLGIPAEAQGRLFQRFYRVKMEGTEHIDGTGLGLSLVKAIVEQHQGAVQVESEVGRGSLFSIRLPALNSVL